MESGKKCGKKSTYRGLEGWSDETHEEITTRIHSCIDLVMDEQEDQWIRSDMTPSPIGLPWWGTGDGRLG